MTHTPKAVRSLLNGTIWNVAFVKIDQRDWATRTRVSVEDGGGWGSRSHDSTGHDPSEYIPAGGAG